MSKCKLCSIKDERIVELLQANNQEVERRRAAETELNELKKMILTDLTEIRKTLLGETS